MLNFEFLTPQLLQMKTIHLISRYYINNLLKYNNPIFSPQKPNTFLSPIIFEDQIASLKVRGVVMIIIINTNYPYPLMIFNLIGVKLLPTNV
jgi:hypothetical protein